MQTYAIQKQKPTITIGASVMPYAIDPTYNNMYLLLGREKNWKNPNQAPKTHWGDFGGASDKHETSEQTASREFWEETMGVVKHVPQARVPEFECGGVHARLEDKKFTYKISYYVSETDECIKVYDMYIMRIPFQKNVKQSFSKTRDTLIGIKNLRSPALTGSYKINSVFLEKIEVQWFSVPQLRAAVADERIGSVPIRKHFLYRLEHALKKLPYFMPRTNPR